MFSEALTDADDIVHFSEPPPPGPPVAVQAVQGFSFELNVLGGKLLYYPAPFDTYCAIYECMAVPQNAHS